MRGFSHRDRLFRLGASIAAVMTASGLPAWQTSARAEHTATSVLRHLDVNSGLPNARVFTIVNTPDGFVWLGTYGGLARFDGASFTTFTRDDLTILGSDSVMALAVDDRGTLWVGTEAGRLVAHDSTGFRHIDLPVQSGQRINAIRSDAAGHLWLGTADGVVMINQMTLVCTAVNEGLAAADVTHLAVDSAGTPWAIAGGVLHRLMHDRWQAVAIEHAGESHVSAVVGSAQGGVWCATMATIPGQGRSTSLHRIDADGRAATIAPGPWPSATLRSRIEALLEDEAGRVWCATRGSGIYRCDPDGKWIEVSKTTSLDRADGIVLSSDGAGSIWVGTRNSGAYQIRQSLVDTFRLPEAAGDHVVTSVCARADGSLWAGTDGAGIFTWRNGAAQRFGLDQGLPSLTVGGVVEACSGQLFAGTVKGVSVLDAQRFVTVRLPTAGACQCLFTDREDRLWVGSAAGACVVDDDVAHATPCDDGDPLDAIAFTQMRDGRIVALARPGSIFEFGHGRFHLISDVPQRSARARAIAVDRHNALWLGTYGAGITHVSGSSLQRWSMQQNGLPSSHVLAIVPWDDTMWICSENGVFGCPVDEFTNAPSGRFALPTWRVGETEGLPEKVCTATGQPAASLGPDRRLWVPNGRSVAGFLPTEIMKPLPVFPPVVERVVADGLEQPLVGMKERVLPAGTGRIELHFTSPNTVAPQRLQFRHRLEGFDNDWVAVADRRMASYTSLPPGNYTFRLEVSDPTGLWRGLRNDLHLRLPPRFWQRRDVQAAFACALAGLLAAAGWAWERRRSQARFALLALERAREQERQRIARDIHDDLGSGLTEIVMLSDVAAREADATPNAATARAIADRARALTRAMDEVVWAVNPRNDSAESFITYFQRWAQAYLGNAGLRVRWNIPVDTTDAPLSAEVRHHLFLACKEAVANVVKHAGANEVGIECRIPPGGLEIVIGDDGRGFAIAAPPGDGDGLSNLRTRLAAIGGSCSIQAGPHRGTTVRFLVPTNRYQTMPEGRA